MSNGGKDFINLRELLIENPKARLDLSEAGYSFLIEYTGSSPSLSPPPQQPGNNTFESELASTPASEALSADVTALENHVETESAVGENFLKEDLEGLNNDKQELSKSNATPSPVALETPNQQENTDAIHNDKKKSKENSHCQNYASSPRRIRQEQFLEILKDPEESRTLLKTELNVEYDQVQGFTYQEKLINILLFYNSQEKRIEEFIHRHWKKH